MRKIFVTLTLFFAVINIMAQEHLSFKGIPIEGSMTAFCQKLKAKGFTSLGRDNNITLFSGDFTGRKATVGVTSTDDGRMSLRLLSSSIQVVSGILLLIPTTTIKIYILVNMVFQQFQKKIILLFLILIQH